MGDTSASGQGSCEVPEASLLSSDPPFQMRAQVGCALPSPLSVVASIRGHFGVHPGCLGFFLWGLLHPWSQCMIVHSSVTESHTTLLSDSLKGL